MARRHLAALAGLGMLLVAPAAMAAPPTYPPATPPSISVSSTSPQVGQAVTVTATGFLAHSPAVVTWTGPSALGAAHVVAMAASFLREGTTSSAANAAGVVQVVLHFSATGLHTIQVSGTGANGKPLTLTTQLTVVAAATAGGGTGVLPRTGFLGLSSTEEIAAALGILVLLLLGVLAVRRRSDKAPIPAPTAPPAPPAQPVGAGPAQQLPPRP